MEIVPVLAFYLELLLLTVPVSGKLAWGDERSVHIWGQFGQAFPPRSVRRNDKACVTIVTLRPFVLDALGIPCGHHLQDGVGKGLGRHRVASESLDAVPVRS